MEQAVWRPPTAAVGRQYNKARRRMRRPPRLYRSTKQATAAVSPPHQHRADLVLALGIRQEWLMCSLIQKFGGLDEADIDVFVKGIHAHLPKGFHAKGGTVRLCG